MSSALQAAVPSGVGPAVEIRGLVKDFSVGLRGLRLRAVDQLSLSVAPGQIFGLLGPNGSGKSTTIKVLLGLLKPDAGECRIFGLPSDQVAARREVGYLPESPDFYRHLSGRELVRYYGRLCGLRGQNLESRIVAVLDTVGLAAAADRRVSTYSKGMLQRVGLAQAIVHDPRLVILDEPTAGVDPVGTAAIIALLLKLKSQGKTVLITSHLLSQMEDICDRVAILDHGQLVIEGAVADLVANTEGESLTGETLPAAELAELRVWLAARGRTLNSLPVPRTRLDRIFLERVGGRGSPRS
jgi:ABC-2 type transport system ATP-binding protein